MNHKGSCHCGNVAFEVEGEIKGVMSCNCSICQRKGFLCGSCRMTNSSCWTLDVNASTYTFNKHAIKHRFCPTCGIHPYGEATDPKGNHIAAINARCLEDVDLASIPVTPVRRPIKAATRGTQTARPLVPNVRLEYHVTHAAAAAGRTHAAATGQLPRTVPAPVRVAGIALLVAAGCTLAVGQGLKLVVDRGFTAGTAPSSTTRCSGCSASSR